MRNPLIQMISLTRLGHGDSLGKVNGGGDVFTDYSRSHEKPLLPLCAGGAAFCVSDLNLPTWKTPIPIPIEFSPFARIIS
jgi:hypothetical protein